MLPPKEIPYILPLSAADADTAPRDLLQSLRTGTTSHPPSLNARYPTLLNLCGFAPVCCTRPAAACIARTVCRGRTCFITTRGHAAVMIWRIVRHKSASSFMTLMRLLHNKCFFGDRQAETSPKCILHILSGNDCTFAFI